MYNKVYVEITNVCNMSCSFCHGHKRAPRFMTRDEFGAVLEKIKGRTEYIYYHLMGEPLLHPELCDFIGMATERGYKSILTTNGTLLSERGDELLVAGLHKVNLSLHSFEEGNGSDHERYVTEVSDFAKKACKNGTIVVFRLWNKGADGGINEETLRLLKKNIDGEWSENARGIKIRDGIYLEWGDRFEWPDTEADIKGEKFFCYGLKDQFGILSDGRVVPCCLDSEGSITLGNIFGQNADEILGSERARAIVDGFKHREASEDLCRRCGYAQRFVKK